MASTDSLPVPRKNTAFRFYFAVRDAAGALVTAFTSPDSEVSKDGGAFTDCTNEATFVGRGVGYIDLTSSEMNADHVSYWFGCNEGSIDPISIAPEELGDIRVNAGQIGGTSQTGRDLGASVLLSSGTGTGQLDFTGGVVKANLTQIGGVAQSATDLKDFADTGYDPVTHGVAKVDGNIGGSVNGSVNGYVPFLSVTSGVVVSGSGDTWAVALSIVTAELEGCVLMFRDGPCAGQSRTVLSWSDPTVVFDSAISPDVDDIFVVYPRVAAAHQGIEADSIRTNAVTKIQDGLASAANLATVAQTTVDTKAKTDNLPASPAAVGSAMTLTSGERSSIGTAVWATSARTLSSFGTLVADIAAAVWAAVTRTLTSSGGATVDDILDAPVPELTGPPAATPTVREALSLLHMDKRNDNYADDESRGIRNNAGVVICEGQIMRHGSRVNIGKLEEADDE